MGTKIECAIDPLATSPNDNSFTLHNSVDDWNYFEIRELKNKFQRSTGSANNFRDSMDRMLEKHNIESIKTTMQIHEDIFKHQVQELHRLYSVQKKLMAEMKKECIQNTRVLNSMAGLDVNNSQFMISKRNHSTIQKNISGYMLNFQNAIEDSSSMERSGSCSGETKKMAARGFDLERPAAAVEDISTAVSVIDNEDQAAAGPSSRLANNNKMSIDGSDEESEVELTLSIGVNSSSKKKMSKSFQQQTLLHSQELGSLNRELDSPASFKSDRGEDFCSPNTPMSSSSATFDQEKKMPHWLFGLSINRT